MMTREEWLDAAVEKWRPIFKNAGVTLPKKIRISVGWPGGRGPKRHVIGQCFGPEMVGDKTPALFVSPVVKDPVIALAVVGHELVHGSGRMHHRKEFSDLAAKIGLQKPWKATTAGPELAKTLRAMAKELGKYDHSPISQSHFKVQTTRLLKVVCPVDDYTARITRKWIDVGFPTCPCGEEMTYG